MENWEMVELEKKMCVPKWGFQFIQKSNKIIAFGGYGPKSTKNKIYTYTEDFQKMEVFKSECDMVEDLIQNQIIAYNDSFIAFGDLRIWKIDFDKTENDGLIEKISEYRF